MRPRDWRFDCTLSSIAPAKQTRRLRNTADCDRQRVARATQTRRYGFHFRKKSGAIVGTFVANYRRLRPTDVRTDGHFFDFDNYIYRLETPIILPTRSTLRPDPSLRLRQSFARLLRSFSLHPVSVFVWVRPAFRSRAVGGVSSRGQPRTPPGGTPGPPILRALPRTPPQYECCILLLFICILLTVVYIFFI